MRKRFVFTWMSLLLGMIVSIGISKQTQSMNGERHGDFVYNVYEGLGRAVVEAYVGTDVNVVVPSEVRGYPVRGIEEDAFRDSNERSVESIFLPSSLTYLYNEHGSTFLGCSKLKTITVDPNNQHFSSKDGVLFNKKKTKLLTYPMGKDDTAYTIPKSVRRIGHSAFSYCLALTSVNIPYGVTYIGTRAFSLCSGLKTITIPKSVKTIGKSAFNECTNMTSIKLSNGLVYIRSYAFTDCRKLKKITISKSVEHIGSNVFTSCYSLKTITIPGSVKKIRNYTFFDCKRLKRVKLSNGIKTIDNYAFFGCKKLKKVTIPKSVRTMGEAFEKSCKVILK